MKKGNLPLETAFEPVEEAHQPTQQTMSRSQNNNKKQNITFTNSEKTDSQTSSIYKDILSQPAQDLSHRQRLLWLQKRRTKGLWVQCDDCDSWRYLPSVLDSHELPKSWYCRMNPDSSLASCSAPEVPIHIRDEEDLIHSEYAAGSLVLARMPGWPWWPAMVDDCPDTEQYYWLDGFSDIPTHYNVVFFDAFEVTRAWMAPAQLKPYTENKNLLKSSSKRKSYNKRLEVAIIQANDADNLSLSDRLIKYSFIARYKGTIASPKTITKNDMKKYQDRFKRKFNIDLPNESDTDNEIDESQSSNKSNVITLGKRIKINEIDINDNNSFKESLNVQVDTNSDLVKSIVNDNSSKRPDTIDQTNIMEDSQITLHRTVSVASDDFDF
ncbi:zinc finger CW-type PWWP domain protein 1-like isoform X1 [Vanessa atalanta]|uniref:zinc finger CW-type PWWP domain protein 1-like isoform X1 n=2 Tax=Vanessa atalanta TaxID=42275 RepID=UPI001FCD86FC|nr:zinc finger CW-type PWWP domain protein 1-like isoform X1 [Vanessa atalanta]